MSDADLLPRPVARDATRRPLTMDEVLAMQADGAFKGQRTQLLDGEIHIMPSDGLRHINYAMEIGSALNLAPAAVDGVRLRLADFDPKE